MADLFQDVVPVLSMLYLKWISFCSLIYGDMLILYTFNAVCQLGDLWLLAITFSKNDVYILMYIYNPIICWNPMILSVIYFQTLVALNLHWKKSICDMIKRNESDVGHIVFEILAKTVFKFLCFILFLALTNSS